MQMSVGGLGAERITLCRRINRLAICPGWRVLLMCGFPQAATPSRSMRASTGRATKNTFCNRHAASLRAVCDLADLENSRFICQKGQSGLVFSSRYRDMSDRWAAMQYRPLPMNPPQFAYELMLKPKPRFKPSSSRDGVKVETVPMAVQGNGGHEVLRHLSIQHLACIGNDDARRGHGHHVGGFAVAEAQRA